MTQVLPAILTPRADAGQPRPYPMMAPIADGTNVSIPPMFGGDGPGHEITGVNTPKLGQGTAEPAFHGGG